MDSILVLLLAVASWSYRVRAEWERSQCCHQMAPFARWNSDQPIACKLAITFVTTTADLDVYYFSLTFEVT